MTRPQKEEQRHKKPLVNIILIRGSGSGKKKVFGERFLTTLDIKLHRDKWFLGFGSLEVIDLLLDRRPDIFILDLVILILVILVTGQVETIKLGGDLVLY